MLDRIGGNSDIVGTKIGTVSFLVVLFLVVSHSRYIITIQIYKTE